MANANEKKESAKLEEQQIDAVELVDDAALLQDELSENDSTDNDSDSDLDKESNDDSDEESDEELSNKLDAPSVSEKEFIDLRKDVRDIGIRKEWLFEVRSVVSKEIKSLFAMLKELKESRDVLTTQVQTLKDDREKINVDIKKAITAIKSTQGPKDVERVDVKKLKKELDKLQFYIETNPLSPEDEKKVMRQIKEKEKMIQKAGPEVLVEKGDAKELSKNINVLKDQSNVIHDKVQANAVESQVKHEAMISVSKEIKFLKAREKEIHSLFVETKSAYKDKRRLLMQNRKFFSQPSSAKKKSPRKVSEKEAMKKVEENIQEKIKLGKKITTEDLLSFGRN